MKLTYAEQLTHPQWQKRRLEILQASDFSCDECGGKEETLHVHHKRYVKGRQVWEYADHELKSVCKTCHGKEHELKDLLSDLLVKIHPAVAISLLGGFISHEPQALSEEQIDSVTYLDPTLFEAGRTAAMLIQLRHAQVEEMAKIVQETHEWNVAQRVAN